MMKIPEIGDKVVIIAKDDYLPSGYMPIRAQRIPCIVRAIHPGIMGNGRDKVIEIIAIPLCRPIGFEPYEVEIVSMTLSEAFRVIEQDYNILSEAMRNNRGVALALAAAYTQCIGRGTPESEHRFTIAVQDWLQWKTDNPDAEELTAK